MLSLVLTHTRHSSITSDHLASFYGLMMEENDDENAYKILELYEKLNDNKFIVSFTGHFSAGKSSMINALLGKDILPKSPIPTSGNIVEITSGYGYARVFFNDGTSLVYEEPYDIEVIKDFSKNNEVVQKIELSTSEKILPEKCVIVDTPGIDAADDADRLMTESSLHLVDCLFYVMDYNHVQSEVNLYFLKQIQNRGIPFYLIINQVDKHDETEIPFQLFIKSVEQTFNQWAVYPKKIFYSSLVDDLNRYNEFNIIKEQLFDLFSSNNEQIDTMKHAVEHIISDHKIFLENKYEQKLTDVTEVNLQEEQLSSLVVLKEQLAEIKQLPQAFEEAFLNDLNQTLKNAYLMPASLRDAATAFLESQQKDFKVGFIGAKKKTAEEKRLRLENFLQPLQKNIEATIQWNFRDKVIALLNQHNLATPELIKSTEDLVVNYTTNDLISLMKPGAQINGPYVLHYTNDISGDIKNKFKNQARKLLDYITEEIIEQTKESIILYEDQIVRAKSIAKRKKKHQQLQQELKEKLNNIDHHMKEPVPNAPMLQLMDRKLVEKSQTIENADQKILELHSEVKKENVMEEKPDQNSSHQSIDQITAAIDQTITTIEGLPGFQSIIDELKMKKENLNNRSLTIALFGAFSAGKSSFSNALIGEALLPSSPNPTTAVISRIAPVTSEYGHATVTIQLKDEQSLMNDILTITKELTPPTTDINELIHWMDDNNIFQNNKLDKMHQTYLQAITLGYSTINKQLGQLITIQIEDFASYVTDETKACFIDHVTLYYDCPLTRLGITLVDTPGADSVNARHTSVAFDYIKYADAILYVTYFNHALSRADKDFLMQLGRVKETFQLDKMFFIINAADLAESPSDLQMVINYVEEQLLQLGIRFPRIFPVSSKASLDNKINKQQLNKQMQDFESSFYQFINKDLVALSIQSAFWDIKRAYQTVTNYMGTIQLNEKEKEDFRSHMLFMKERLLHVVDESKADMYEERIYQRIDRQLHYVKERLSIRFHDLFTDRFNPVTISGSGRKANQLLVNSLKQLIDDTGYELLQELRAVSLRIESFLKNLMEEVYSDFQDRTQAIDQKFSLPMIELANLQTPEYDQAFITLEIQQFNKALNLFKGTKAFFERGEKDAMREAIYDILIPHIDQYIIYNQQIMDKTYLKQWQDLFATNKQQVKININQHIDNNLNMIEEKVDISVLKEKQQILSSLIDR